ncbi:hypothetical protein OV079_02650 [Nannocystis pusilla]|uniref:Uncharacterized protein n=1 Tax=Nannocystis pusilla TaxID=889268 RepID=A0A9X3EIU5_9BACT|nr:hypothetical protein [Nannocystis pusilla]MCY1004486.1 hypothetical protein [Nannocystis pusilla]
MATLKDVPSSWRNRLREYYNILSDSAASELPNQLDYVVRGCHRYLLKRAIRTNVRQIATGTSPAGQLAVKVQEVEKALEAIDKTDRTELEVAMGLNATQMRALVDETLTHTRESLRRGQLANIAALSAGLFLVLATAISVFAGGDANIWTAATGGMGAAATIAALITAPRRNIENGASRLIYIQTAYFSFLTQIRLLGIPGEETTLQRSERLEAATAKLLDQMMAITKDGT